MRRSLITTSVAVAATLLWANAARAHPDYGCNSCHVPHGAYSDTSVPLWNPTHTSTTLVDNYTSVTLDATISAPDGAAKLCLSCHDGSSAGVHAEHRFGDGNTLGALTSNHPISMVYDAALVALDPDLVDPSTLAKDILDKNGKVQCTSCHDIHADGRRQDAANLRWPYPVTDVNGNVLVANTPGMTASFCRHCHKK